MSVLKIARMGHPVLLRRCDPVADPGAPEIRRLVADMMDTMEDAPGVGLAAIQIGAPQRVVTIDVAKKDDPKTITDKPADPLKQHAQTERKFEA
mgnify:CR=1 FL=1